nr:ribonuclease H-like domain, reverse transcriptase, RNA-dependent DNA polymerase [Tanacetum cinerariifolium]
METQKPLLKDEDGKEVDVHVYRLMIGSLMYLTSSRLDIMFTVCACARYQVNLKVSHVHAVKRIFKYLKVQETDSVNSITEAEYVAALRKAKKNVRLMMKKLFGMKLELLLFWSTTMAKTINGEVQLHALIYGKEIVITESSVRKDLQLADEEVSKSKDYYMQLPQRSNKDVKLEMAKLIKSFRIFFNDNVFPHEEASMEVLLAKERILKLIQAWDDKKIESWSLPALLL